MWSLSGADYETDMSLVWEARYVAPENENGCHHCEDRVSIGVLITEVQ